MVTYYFYFFFFKTVLGREHSGKVSKIWIQIHWQFLFLRNHLKVASACKSSVRMMQASRELRGYACQKMLKSYVTGDVIWCILGATETRKDDRVIFCQFLICGLNRIRITAKVVVYIAAFGQYTFDNTACLSLLFCLTKVARAWNARTLGVSSVISPLPQ